MTEETPPAERPVLDEQLIDPNAPTHKRIIEQPINDMMFDFHWTRIHAAELIHILAGRKETSNDTSSDGMRRMLLKTVDPTQKGMLLDMLNNRANYTLTRQLIEGMLPLVTNNETVIGSPVNSQQGDVKQCIVPLITDGRAELFHFKSNRTRFDAFQQKREEVGSEPADEIYHFLAECLEDPKEKQRFDLLEFDERNFTLSVKIYSKLNSFLARNQDTTKRPTLKK